MERSLAILHFSGRHQHLKALPCSQTTLVRSSDIMDLYPELTGDIQGVESTDGGVIAKCFDQHFWYAPACRSNALPA